MEVSGLTNATALHNLSGINAHADSSKGPRREEHDLLDLIRCDGCGRWFPTTDGPGMIRIIKGSCPDCGGTFHLDPHPARRSAPQG
jgi:rRNA maturation endonuclease Nob1